MMSKQSSKKIPNTDESWESGLLGADAEYVRVVQKELSSEVDETLELQMISIRLSKELIKAYRLLGARHGMGYQPLMREVLKRFVDSEFKMIAQETLEKQIRNLVKETEKENKKVA
jgi:uncharacterized protein (DUF4415 family)